MNLWIGCEKWLNKSYIRTLVLLLLLVPFSSLITIKLSVLSTHNGTSSHSVVSVQVDGVKLQNHRWIDYGRPLWVQSLRAKKIPYRSHQTPSTVPFDWPLNEDYSVTSTWCCPPVLGSPRNVWTFPPQHVVKRQTDGGSHRLDNGEPNRKSINTRHKELYCLQTIGSKSRLRR